MCVILLIMLTVDVEEQRRFAAGEYIMTNLMVMMMQMILMMTLYEVK